MATHDDDNTSSSVLYYDLLPPEIWRIIVELSNPASLLALCLVSRAFRAHAQPKLFQSVHILLPELYDWEQNPEDEHFLEQYEQYASFYADRAHRLCGLEEALSRNLHLAHSVSSLTLEATRDAEAYGAKSVPILPLQAMRAMINLKSLALDGEMCPYEEGTQEVIEMIDILCRTSVQELTLHCPHTSYNIDGSGGLTKTQLARISTLSRLEWVFHDEEALSISSENHAPEESPIYALLLASHENLTAISFPFYTSLPEDTQSLLCDLKFPHLTSLILGPHFTTDESTDFLHQNARFTKFIRAHPLLELLDLGYSCQAIRPVISANRLVPENRLRSMELDCHSLSSDSLPCLRNFRGSTASLVALEQAGVSSLSQLHELGLTPLHCIPASTPDMGDLTASLRMLLSSSRRPKLQVLHIDFRWEKPAANTQFIEVLGLCAQLWEDTLETWAGTLSSAVRFEEEDVIKMFGGFRNLKTFYLPAHFHVISKSNLVPEARTNFAIELLAQALPSLERVRVEHECWSCPLAESRTSGPLTWDEWKISREIIEVVHVHRSS